MTAPETDNRPRIPPVWFFALILAMAEDRRRHNQG